MSIALDDDDDEEDADDDEGAWAMIASHTEEGKGGDLCTGRPVSCQYVSKA